MEIYYFLSFSKIFKLVVQLNFSEDHIYDIICNVVLSNL